MLAAHQVVNSIWVLLAFAPEAQGWLRWCFASRDPQRLVQGVARLEKWLTAQGR